MENLLILIVGFIMFLLPLCITEIGVAIARRRQEKRMWERSKLVRSAYL